MGSRDDDWFAERYKEGKNQVVFTENSPGDDKWCAAFTKIVRDEGLVPIFYSGAGRDITSPPGMSSTLDDAIRDDFYPATTKVLYLGPPKQGADYDNHWVLSQLKYVNPNHHILIYVSPDYPAANLRTYGYNGKAKIVNSIDDFIITLRNDLQNFSK